MHIQVYKNKYLKFRLILSAEVRRVLSNQLPELIK